MCIRAGLYQQKNGLLVLSGSLRSSQSMTLAEISSSMVLDRSSVNGPALSDFLIRLRAVGRSAGENRSRRDHADRGLHVH